jgi:hypothetical protein
VLKRARQLSPSWLVAYCTARTLLKKNMQRKSRGVIVFTPSVPYNIRYLGASNFFPQYKVLSCGPHKLKKSQTPPATRRSSCPAAAAKNQRHPPSRTTCLPWLARKKIPNPFPSTGDPSAASLPSQRAPLLRHLPRSPMEGSSSEAATFACKMCGGNHERCRGGRHGTCRFDGVSGFCSAAPPSAAVVDCGAPGLRRLPRPRW